MEFKGSWDNYLALIEFAYNNSYQSIIGMAPYEALYGRSVEPQSAGTKWGRED